MKQLSRQHCIEDLRGHLLGLVDDEHSMCQVASRLGIYCHGFSQWSFDELKQRYWWLVERRPGIKREELERLANIWQVARQQVFGTQLACDTQTLEHDTCCGFDGWSNADLSRFHKELLGQAVEVVDDAED
jgi:hypothetical protein